MPDVYVHASYLAGAIYAAMVLFLLAGFLRSRPRLSNGARPKVSVVVPARNEAANLQSCLQALVAQSYPRDLIEIVVVNDRSHDATGEIARRFQAQHSNLFAVEVTETPTGVSPKKYALSQGIVRAGGELVFTTDADCAPPREWLAQMVPLFSERVGLVMGAAPFHERPHWLARLLALDNLASTFVAVGGCGWNIGVTCTGRNLAYRKAVFNQVNGFRAINHSLSGDDDLFMQLVKKRTDWRISFSLSPETAVPSPSARTVKDFVRQRRRHVSAGKYYSRGVQVAYLVFNLANLTLFAFLFVALFTGSQVRPALSLFLSKVGLDFVALFCVAKRLRKMHLLLHFPLWQIFHLINQVVISPLGFVGRIRW